MKNKTKAWRRMAQLHNLVATIKEGSVVRHQGRKNKTIYVNAPSVPSMLVRSLLVSAAEAGNYTLTFTKKELADIEKQYLEQQASEVPNETE